MAGVVTAINWLKVGIQVATTTASIAYSNSQNRKLRRKMAAAAEARKGFDLPVRGEPAYVPIVYGKQMIGGIETVHQTSSTYAGTATNCEAAAIGGKIFSNGLAATAVAGTKNEFLTVQTALCHGGIEGVQGITVNDSPYTYAEAKFRHRFHTFPVGGTADTAATAQGLPATNRFTNCAYVSSFYYLNRDENNYTGIPTAQYSVKGRKVRTVVRSGTSPNYTYALSTAYSFSTNPALCLLDYLTNATFGRGLRGEGDQISPAVTLANSEVDLESFYNSAQVCDIVVFSQAEIGGNVNEVKPFQEYSSFSVFPPVAGTSSFTQTQMQEYIYKATDAPTVFYTFARGALTSGADVEPATYAAGSFSVTTVNRRNLALYECNITLDSQNSIRDNIEELLETMGLAEMTWSSEGKYKLMIEHPVQTQSEKDAGNNACAELDALVDSTHHFTEDDIMRADLSLSWPSANDRFNQVTVSFDNEHEDFKSDSATFPKTGSSVHNTFLAEDNNQPFNADVRGIGITDPYHALAKAEGQVRASREMKTISLTLGKKSLSLEPGDFIKLTIPNSNISNEVFRVQSVKISGDFTAEIAAYSFTPSMLAWNVEDDIAYAVKPEFDFTVPAPTSGAFTFDSNNILGTSAGKLTWTAADASAEYLIEVSADNTTYETLGTTRATTFDVVGLATGVYDFSIRTKLASGSLSERLLVNDKTIQLKTVGKVAIVYGNTANAASNTQSYTLGNNQFVAYFSYTGDTPTLPIRTGITFTKFKGSVIRVVADKQLVTFSDQNVETPSSQVITLTAELQNLANTTATFSVTSGVTLGTVAGAGNANKRTISGSQFSSKDSIVVTITDADNTVSDTITLYKLKDATDGTPGIDGTGGLTAFLSNESHTFPADKDGVISSTAGSGTLISLFEGTTQLDFDGFGTANGKFKVNISAFSTGVTAGSISNSGLNASVAASTLANANDSGTITYTIIGRTLLGVAISGMVKVQSFSKSRVGVTGGPGGTGPTGASNNAIFQRSASQPSTPSNSSGVPSGWYDDSASATGGLTLWLSIGVKAVGATTFSWSAPTIIEGTKVQEVYIYRKRTAGQSAPPQTGSDGISDPPYGSSIHLGTGIINLTSFNSNWSQTLPALTADGDKIYRAIAVASGSANSTVSLSFGNIVLFAQRTDGAAGGTGPTGASGSPGTQKSSIYTVSSDSSPSAMGQLYILDAGFNGSQGTTTNSRAFHFEPYLYLKVNTLAVTAANTAGQDDIRNELSRMSLGETLDVIIYRDASNWGHYRALANSTVQAIGGLSSVVGGGQFYFIVVERIEVQGTLLNNDSLVGGSPAYTLKMIPPPRGAGLWNGETGTEALPTGLSTAAINAFFATSTNNLVPVDDDRFILSNTSTGTSGFEVTATAYIYKRLGNGASGTDNLVGPWLPQAEFIPGNLLVTGTVTAERLNITDLSSLNATLGNVLIEDTLQLQAGGAGFIGGRTNNSAYADDGFYIARTDKGGGNLGFEVSHTSVNPIKALVTQSPTNRVTGVIHKDDDGLKLLNPTIMIGGSATGGSNLVTTAQNVVGGFSRLGPVSNTGTTLEVTVYGGGGGGGSGYPNYSGSVAPTASQKGGTTRIIVRNGSHTGTVLADISATGGVGGFTAPNTALYPYNTQGTDGQASTFGAGGTRGGGGGAVGGDAPSTSYGAGGGGGGGDSTTKFWEEPGAGGYGGLIGQSITQSVNVPSGASVYIEYQLGAGGLGSTGNNVGGDGAQGAMSYSSVLGGMNVIHPDEIANGKFDKVGSYAYLLNTVNQQVAPGSTRAGGTLRWSGTSTGSLVNSSGFTVVNNQLTGPTASGTWMAMGGKNSVHYLYLATLWVRVL